MTHAESTTDRRAEDYATAYIDARGYYHDAIQLDWQTVQRVLGRKHDGTPFDDEILVEWMHRNGFPDWIDDAEGWVDEEGWGLFHPVPVNDPVAQLNGHYAG